MNIAEMLFIKARQIEEAPAVTANDTTLSFGELSHRVACIGGSLTTQLGISPGERVVLWMENRLEFVELLFACWAAGMCVVPANYKLHPRELDHIVRDADARFIFTSAKLAQALDEYWAGHPTAMVITAESPSYAALREGSPISSAEVDPDELAWIFYTSGTTGFPKGAMLTHRNLLFMIMAYYADIEQVAPGKNMVHAAPLSHGTGQYMLPHLLAGGHQIVLPRFDVGDVVRVLERYTGVSVFMVPTMITRLTQGLEQRPDWAKNISHIIYGGAPMYVSDLVEAMELLGPCFFQLYGQGETPMTITGLSRREHERAYATGDHCRLATCGTPRLGVEVKVVDDVGNEVPPGTLGEVITRSDCVMRGYWNNSSATASALRGGWLWTGDIGTLDAGGYLSLRDRSKDMIISGGTNIYPREIEEVLLTHAAVAECSVIGRAHPDLGEEPVAFVVCHPATSVTPAELDALCIAQIARFKRPRDYRFVSSLPKSAYGKVLKTALREQLISAPSDGSVSVS